LEDGGRPQGRAQPPPPQDQAPEHRSPPRIVGATLRGRPSSPPPLRGRVRVGGDPPLPSFYLPLRQGPTQRHPLSRTVSPNRKSFELKGDWLLFPLKSILTRKVARALPSRHRGK